ncbi:MAG: metallophosphoesterase [Cyanobacteriota bacterium]
MKDLKSIKLLDCSILMLLFSFCFTTESMAGIGLSPDPNNAPNGSVMAIWTQIIGNDSSNTELAGVSRFIIQGANKNCGDYTLSKVGGSYANVFTGNFYARSYPAKSTDSDSSKFPITVCETSFDPSWTSAILQKSNKDVNLWSSSGTAPKASFPTLYSVGRKNNGTIKIAGFGDSGCRDNDDQSCNKDSDWPARSLSVDAANKNPDLVIHTGDYRYSNKGSSDQWKYWYQEFFYPVQSLLLKAPLVPSRGNHETCNYEDTSSKKAPWGTGWFYFLQNRTISDSISCSSNNYSNLPPWYFDVKVRTTSPSTLGHRFIMMDSSEDNSSNIQVDNFKTMLNLSNDVTSSWWVTHKPLWGVHTDESGKTPKAVESNMQKDLTTAISELSIQTNTNKGVSREINDPPSDYIPNTDCWKTDSLPCSLKAIIAGHIHMLQSIRFYTTGSSSNTWIRPIQYVVGNSGVNIDSGLTHKPCSFNLPSSNPSVNGANLKAVNEWDTKFGYVIWERSQSTVTGSQSGWTLTRYFSSGGPSKETNSENPNDKTDYPNCVIDK